MLRPLVDDVLDLTRSLVDSSVDLRNNVPPGMVVAGDAGRIVQILNNLLGNAAKFTRRGHIRVRFKAWSPDMSFCTSNAAKETWSYVLCTINLSCNAQRVRYSPTLATRAGIYHFARDCM